MRSKKHEYQAAAITVSYDVKRCIHAEECIHGLPAVFDFTKRPWVQPEYASAVALAEVIMRCPTGALQFERKDDGPAEPIPAENIILIEANGPLYVRGKVELTDMDGGVLHQDTRVALCRCGASKIKPFCDNTHLQINFQAEAGVTDNREETVDLKPVGPIKFVLAPNGPYRLQGNFEIRSADGRAIFRGNKTALCRCGSSQNKPFCDGTHKSIGFLAE
ncbi:MAG: CDGSH iron-sulfur domain-containing protein [Candidatus Marinimicrobia bacterium]|nr:CDGSH iron-sulfur domain-containing protein [Candidatus Neomarinimicrobiota bacterium]